MKGEHPFLISFFKKRNPFWRLHMCLLGHGTDPLPPPSLAQIPITGKSNWIPSISLEQSEFNKGYPFLSEVWVCQQGEGNWHWGKTPVILTPVIPEDLEGILGLQTKALGHLPWDLHLGKRYPWKIVFWGVWFHKAWAIPSPKGTVARELS